MDYKKTSKLFLKHARLDLATAQELLEKYKPNYDKSGIMRPLDLRWSVLYHIQQAYEKGTKAFLYIIVGKIVSAFEVLNAESQDKLKISCPEVYAVFLGDDGLKYIEPKKLNHDFNLFMKYMKRLDQKLLVDFFKELSILITDSNQKAIKTREVDADELKSLTTNLINNLSTGMPEGYSKIKKKIKSRSEEIIKTHKGSDKYITSNIKEQLSAVLDSIELLSVAIELYPFESISRYGLIDGYFDINKYLSEHLNGKIERLPDLFDKLDLLIK